ncbi:MAG: hypothetical protein ACTSU2_08460 [Promethearchaeota archaeon]
MNKYVFRVMTIIADITEFELEYREKIDDPFMEKWLYTSINKHRQAKLRNFLYKWDITMLKSRYAKKFYNTILKEHLNLHFSTFMEELVKGTTNKKSLLYELIYYKLKIEDLFVHLTQVINWEHLNYPYMLEYSIIYAYRKKHKILDNYTDLFEYYIRFLDLLSSEYMKDIADIKELKKVLKEDNSKIGQMPLEELEMFKKWPLKEEKTFMERFPDFQENLNKELFTVADIFA